MSIEVEQKTINIVHAVVKFPLLFVLLVLWIVVVTPVFFVRFVACLILNLFRMMIRSYDNKNSSEPIRALIYFMAIYPMLTSRLIRNTLTLDSSDDTNPTGLNFVAEVIFFFMVLLGFTIVNYRDDIFSGLISKMSYEAAPETSGAAITWLFAVYASISLIAILIALSNDVSESTPYRWFSVVIVLFGGCLLALSIFGWPA